MWEDRQRRHTDRLNYIILTLSLRVDGKYGDTIFNCDISFKYITYNTVKPLSRGHPNATEKWAFKTGGLSKEASLPVHFK